MSAVADQDSLESFFRAHHSVLVITGAGCSTSSGIADYRDANGDWKHASPIMAQDFMRSATVRQRYWARSMRGWPAFARAAVNPAHEALASLERMGLIHGVITQNVDGLHQRAGQRKLIELHGNLQWVCCTGCGARIGRAGLQDWLSRVNPQVNALPAAPAPDGDAQLARELDGVRVPECADCGAIVKPDVVFYGESVPPERVREAYRWVDEADALMVVGSSLMVYSSYRFVRRARERGLPLVAINQGKTRADDWWHFKLAEDCTSALQRLVGELSGAAR